MTQDSKEDKRRKHMVVMDDAMIEPVEDPDFLWHGVIADDASLSYQCFGELGIEPDEFNTRWAYPPTKYVRHDLFQAVLARADRLEALLREARMDLEHYVTHEYPKHLHPYYEQQWNRDMELCRRIDAELQGDDQ